MSRVCTCVLEPKYGLPPNREPYHVFDVITEPPDLPDLWRWNDKVFAYFGQRGQQFIYRERTVKDV